MFDYYVCFAISLQHDFFGFIFFFGGFLCDFFHKYHLAIYILIQYMRDIIWLTKNHEKKFPWL